MHPAIVTCQIKEVATTRALLCTHHVHEDRLNHVHLSACWSSIGQLVRQRPAERCWLQRNAEALELLMHHTVLKAEARETDARGLATAAHGAAHSGMCLSLGLLFAALARAAERQMSYINMQELANTA